MNAESKAFHKRCEKLPIGEGYVAYEVILPKQYGRTCGWLMGTDGKSALEASPAEVAAITSPFSNEQRVTVIKAIFDGYHTFKSLGQITGMTNGRLQHHLKELALHNLLKRTSERNHYELSEHGQALMMLFCHIAKWEPTSNEDEYLTADTMDTRPDDT
jgi:DNA-binding HxlR family transcriptional regulator